LTVGKTKLMLSPTFRKKISQIAATTALGTAMLSAAVTAPADAANIKSYNISGQFASKAVTGSVGLPALLQGGSFKGSYEVDTDQLPDNGRGVFLQKWEVSLFDSSNNFVKKFSQSIPNNFAFIQTNILRFAQANYTPLSISAFSVIFPPGFKGEGNIQGGILDYNEFSGSFGSIAVASGKSEVVPEPLTLGGTAVAGTIGIWLKRKQRKTSQAA
jgi:hypothetical protein